MKTTLRSRDLTCPSCIAKIEKGLLGLEGVTDARVHFNSGRIEVEHEESTTDVTTIRTTIKTLGYDTEEDPW